MKIKLFNAPTISEAMTQVKKELGRDAVILHTRRLRKGGVLGFFGQEIVEVMAAVDSDSPAKSVIEKKAVAPLQEPVEQPDSAPKDQEQNQDLTSLKMEMSSVRKMMEELIEQASKIDIHELNSTNNQSPLAKLLLKNDIDSNIVASLLEGIPEEQALQSLNSEFVKQMLVARIAQYLRNVNGIQISPSVCKKVAFIGSTGVGKTTTIAKLAANFSIKEGYKVVLITADTYRIAAIEQLRIYADIIGIPIEIVYSPEELKAAFNRHNDKNLILVDTAGRSPNSLEQLVELKELLNVDPDIETHLVLSSTIRYKETLDMVNKFSICFPHKLLFTKIDEACTLGTLLNLAYYMPSTLSYITMGQNVPEDIELVNPDKLAAMMLRDF